MKLTPSQQTVVAHMQDGWELGYFSTAGWTRSRAWLQKGGVGRGGDTRKVNMATFRALVDKKVIKLKERAYPTSIYRLA